jgi:DNA polymerase-4
VRRFGVRSAMPVRQALQRCPHAICVRPRFERYQAVSRQVFEVFRQYTPLVEGLSLDEAFLDVTASRRLHGDGETIARAIKARVREVTGLTISIGVASNKLVAKIASDLHKPDGLTVVRPGEEAATLAPLPVQRLPGLGRKKGDAAAAAGLRSIGDLQRADETQLLRLFGRDGPRWRTRALGVDDRPVVPVHEEKSVSAETTFDRDIADPGVLRAELLALADKASGRLRAKALAAGTVSIKIRLHDFTTFTRQAPLRPSTNDGARISQSAARLLQGWLRANPGARLRLLGVGTSAFEATATQADLFASSPQNAPEAAGGALDHALDRIRERFGKNAVQRAGILARRRPGDPRQD